MAQTITNITNMDLVLAVFMAHDEYDHSKDENVISATSLIKPMRELVLSRQYRHLDTSVDVSSLVGSRIGTAIHTGVENVWLDRKKLEAALKALGHPQSIIDRIIVNPTPGQIKKDSIVVYSEIRATRKVGKYILSGKFDFVVQGAVEDIKSTKTYTYIKGTNDEDYRKQGSIYRWLNPTLIIKDIMKIQYIFKDWMKLKTITDKDYPPSEVVTKKLQLMSLEDTNDYIVTRLAEMDSLMNSPQEDLPYCTKQELWADEPVYKYYKDPSKTARSTKNFNTLSEANERLIKDKGVGVVKTVEGQVRKCKYCKVLEICDQAKLMVENGSLTI